MYGRPNPRMLTKVRGQAAGISPTTDMCHTNRKGTVKKCMLLTSWVITSFGFALKFPGFNLFGPDYSGVSELDSLYSPSGRRIDLMQFGVFDPASQTGPNQERSGICSMMHTVLHIRQQVPDSPELLHFCSQSERNPDIGIHRRETTSY